MEKNPRKKLALKQETLRKLRGLELTVVASGTSTVSDPVSKPGEPGCGPAPQ